MLARAVEVIVSRPPHDREIVAALMYSLPPDIFRRAMGQRLFRQAEESLQKLRKALIGEYEVSARAAKFHIAAVVMKLIDRPDLEQEFIEGRDEAVQQARAELAMRRPAKKIASRSRIIEKDNTISKQRRRADDQPYKKPEDDKS